MLLLLFVVVVVIIVVVVVAAIKHVEKLIAGSNIHPTMVPFAMVVDSTFGEIDWWQQNP